MPDIFILFFLTTNAMHTQEKVLAEQLTLHKKVRM